MVSDREATEQEYAQLRDANPKLFYNQQAISRLRKQVADSLMFQYNTEEMERLVTEQNYNKIKTRNFNGLNITSIKMTIQGELALAQSSLADLKMDDYKTIEEYKRIYDPLREKYESLQELM